MRYAWRVLIWILAGAVAAGAGLSIVLYRTNRDRAELIRLLQAAEGRVKAAEQNQRATADQANERMRQASEEVQRAEAILKSLTEERDALTRAVTLTKSRQSASWKETISLPLGLSLRTPPGYNVVVTTSADGQPRLAIYPPISNAAYATNTRAWMFVTPYTESSKGLEQTIQHGEDVAYTVADKLLIGKRGESSTGEESIVLRAQAVASSSHLFVATIEQAGEEKRLLEILATLTFAP